MQNKQSLKLRFKELPHQESALKNIFDVFTGLDHKHLTANKYPQGNPYLNLQETGKWLEENINRIRSADNIDKGSVQVRNQDCLNIDILMETGTGKTFTFLETIYKLNHTYGLAKFIILVPSNAIRQGTIKSIEATREFFQRKYSKKHLEVFDYSQQSINGFNYNSNQNISVLVMTYQSFNKDSNTINKKGIENSLFKKQSFMEELAEIRPVIIMDEPHKFTGKKTQEFLPKFKPQIILRFGATFRDNYSNLIFVLDSAAAFKQSLVKTITVKQIKHTGQSQHNLKYLGYKGIAKERKAEIEYNPAAKSNKKVSLSVGDNIGDELSIEAFKGYTLADIKKDQLIFTNDHVLLLDEMHDYSGLDKRKSQLMLEQTIATHFEREEELFKRNIKSLSLIFVDSVEMYMLKGGGKGELAKAFEIAYKNKLEAVLKTKGLDPKYREYLKRSRESIDKVHRGYFAISKGIKDQEESIDLILKHKERLLSHDEDLRFIFSMWALQEGWDNPNIFTLCKLAPSKSSITKLQQIGRGLRLAVKQTAGGYERLTREDISSSEFNLINKLNVIVPGEEVDFVKDIQRAISENSSQSHTNFMSIKVLCNLGITETEWSAGLLIQLLAKHNLIDLDMVTGESKIISKKGIKDVVKEALEQKIVFNHSKLIALFDDFLDLDGVVAPASQSDNIDVTINKKLWPKFKILWEEINRESSYSFSIDQNKLHADIISEINSKLDINPVSFIIEKTENLEAQDDANKSSSHLELADSYSFFSFREFVKRIADETKLSFQSIMHIMKEIDEDKFKMLAGDEVRAIEKISEICIRNIRKQIKDSLKFEISDKAKVGTGLTDDKFEILKSIKLISMGKYKHIISNKAAKSKSLTKDIAGRDSDFEGEVIEQSHLDEIDVFAKIPEISIPIPGGKKYNPDFAYVVTNSSGGNKPTTYHLVLETKGYQNEDYLRGTEKFKIEVAQKFFEALNDRKDNSKVSITYKPFYDDNDTLEGTIGGMFQNKPIPID